MGDSTYYESPSLSPELTTNVTSPSGSAGNLGVTVGTFIGRVQFEFISPPPMSADVEVLEETVLVSAWAVWSTPALSDTSGHPNPLVCPGCVNSRESE